MKQNDNNFINESHLFAQGKTLAKTYTTTAREPSIYFYLIFICYIIGQRATICIQIFTIENSRFFDSLEHKFIKKI